MKQINQITLPSLHFNSQAGNINDDQDELIGQILVKFSMIFQHQFGYDLGTKEIVQLQQEQIMQKNGQKLIVDMIKQKYTKSGEDLVYACVDVFQRHLDQSLDFIETINKKGNRTKHINLTKQALRDNGLRSILNSDDIHLVKAACEYSIEIDNAVLAEGLSYRLARLICPSYVRGTPEQRKESRDWHLISLRYSKKIQNVFGYMENCRCISHTYEHDIKTAHNAKTYLEKGLKAAKKKSVNIQTWLCMETDKNQILLKLRRNKQAIQLIQETLAKSIQYGCEREEAICYLNLATIASFSGDDEASLALHNDARVIGQRLDDKYILSAANSGIGMLKQFKERK